MSLFGSLPIPCDALARMLATDSDLTWDSPQNSIKSILYELGNKDGLVFCRRRGLVEGTIVQEWLLDLVWLDKETLAMKLAVESELALNMNQRLDDFEKLMSTKAPLKLFIYRAREDESANVRKRLEQYLENFPQHIEGEEYLLMEMAVNQKSACFHRYRVPGNGKIDKISFVRLPLERSSSAS
jgi:hypothetical protein